VQTKFPLKRVVVPHGIVSRLTPEEKYSLYLLGHIFNETMALMRLAKISECHPYESATDAQKAGAVFNTTFFCRLLAGKLYEAQQSLNSKVLRDFLTAQCFPHIEDEEGQALLKAFNKSASGCKWLNEARNGHAMHYPTFKQCEGALGFLGENKTSFEFVHGPVDGQTLYQSSDILAGLAFFLEVDSSNWLNGATTMMQDLGEVAGNLCDFLQRVIGAFVEEAGESGRNYKEKVKIKNIRSFSIPNFTGFHLPYFFKYPNKSSG
jgi:hypothetical protein